MLKHGRAGVPLEVMGLMLGDFVDEYTVRVIGAASLPPPPPPPPSHLARSLTLIHLPRADVFAMPQSGTGVSVEAVDPVFQTKMLDMLKQTGRCVLLSHISLPRPLADSVSRAHRPEMVVGWYHSHPGFGCWLSSVDVNTQQVRPSLPSSCSPSPPRSD